MSTPIPRPSKKARKAEIAAAQTPLKAELQDAPSVLVEFVDPHGQAVTVDASSGAGTSTGAIRIPSNLDSEALALLVNTLKGEKDEPYPYSFHIVLPASASAGPDEQERIPLEQSIYQTILQSQAAVASVKGKQTAKRGLSTEDTLRIVCQPEALFRVRPINRNSSSLSGHGAPILCAAFSPTGKWLATGSGDFTARIWDLSTETPRFTLGGPAQSTGEGATTTTGHRGWVLCVEWDPLERFLATGSHDNTVRIWSPATGKQVGEPLRGHSKWITSLAWEPLHLSGEGVRLASSSKDSTVKIWNATAGRLENTLGGHTASVNVVRWSGTGLIITASSDRTIRLWKDGKTVRVLSEHAHWVTTMALNTDFILRTGPFDPVGPTPANETEARTMAKDRYARFVATKEELLISGSDDHTLFLWTLSESAPNPKKPLARLTGHQKQVNHVAFSPDGNQIASASFDNSVKLWQGDTGKFIASLRGHVAPVYRVSWSADSRMLISASKDSTLKLWNLKTHKIRVDLPGHTDEVYCVDFVADKVASGGRDQQVKIWRN
ncbi:uncharacterized protein L969DRAFT_85645 [Mixia osmundae IAM 14324]|uniref:Uncharacterized protein n=1 Tax=Mixia osmundae (strain CBS 9802 / IAM 14324 / JCM 22182 / KY 12970) TaxID=764103 RepID=G7E6A3_MIXOS|nr:uncharacterized protein L969DRAFT_85645 [Mixia osmundae IAM 14324]KEI40480.1 hypothetical protein L969DRAFT_85645 [Mixia osmundae IAM 14324]GAA98363.1 hypothetical protein E5Q_05049 [Mixia osmundae IAM 14324]